MRRLVVLSLLSLLLGCVTSIGEAGPKPLKAAFGKVDITPWQGVPMGGYYRKERTTLGESDPLYARCMVLEFPDGKSLTFVSADIVGFLRYDVLLMKEELTDPDSVFFFATHNHSGPDTLGVFGQGRDEKFYMKETRAALVKLIKRTRNHVQPARMFVGATSGKGLNINWRHPKEISESVNFIKIQNLEGKLLGSLVNFPCHPETFGKENIVSADFPGYLSEKLEKETGGISLYINGALGAMVSANTSKLKNQTKGPGQMAEFGDLIFDRVTKGWKSAWEFKFKERPPILTAEPIIHVDNRNFLKMLKEGTVPSDERTFTSDLPVHVDDPSDEIFRPSQYGIRTEVSLISLGPIKILMLPGEATPQLFDALRSAFPGSMILAFGLANDEIGYLTTESRALDPVHESDWKSMISRKAGSMIYDCVKILADQLKDQNPPK